MHENVLARGADGFAYADFVSAFRNGNEHDIHDADTANEERDTADESKYAGNNIEKSAGGVGNFVAVSDGKILVAGFLGRKGGFDIFGYLWKDLDIGGFDVDLLDLNSAGETGESFGVHNDGIVEINVVKINGFIDFIEYANDHEFFAENSDGLPDGATNGVK